MVFPANPAAEAATLSLRSVLLILVLVLSGLLAANTLLISIGKHQIASASAWWLFASAPLLLLALLIWLLRRGTTITQGALLGLLVVFWLIAAYAASLNGWVPWPMVGVLAMLGFLALPRRSALTLAVLGPLLVLATTTLHLGALAWDPALFHLRNVWLMALIGAMAMAGVHQGLQGQSPAQARGRLDERLVLVLWGAFVLSQVVLELLLTWLLPAHRLHTTTLLVGLPLLLLLALLIWRFRDGTTSRHAMLPPWARTLASALALLMLLLSSLEGLRFATAWPLVAASVAYLLPWRWAAAALALSAAAALWAVQGNPDATALAISRGAAGLVVAGFLGALLRHHVYTQLGTDTDTDTRHRHRARSLACPPTPRPQRTGVGPGCGRGHGAAGCSGAAGLRPGGGGREQSRPRPRTPSR